MPYFKLQNTSNFHEGQPEILVTSFLPVIFTLLVIITDYAITRRFLGKNFQGKHYRNFVPEQIASFLHWYQHYSHLVFHKEVNFTGTFYQIECTILPQAKNMVKLIWELWYNWFQLYLHFLEKSPCIYLLSSHYKFLNYASPITFNFYIFNNSMQRFKNRNTKH